MVLPRLHRGPQQLELASDIEAPTLRQKYSLEPNNGAEIRLSLGKVMPTSRNSSHDSLQSASGFETGGMRITFKELTYTVKSHHDKKVDISLLKRVSGFFNPGEMSALMGPSGSGKTTLLDVLAGRKTTGKTDGTVLFAGVKPSSMFLRRYTGYVEQFDTLVDVLTVEEMLLYTAQLKRPLQECNCSKRAAVNTLIGDLGLEGCRSTRIGNSMNRGISGGQAKRTNIGIAMITNPRVLFLDEPTSGLDSYTCNEVMTVVKALVKSGITICATIHSPTPYAFRLFDRMMLLLRGRVVYFGARGQEATDYFKNVPLPDGQMMTSLGEGANEAEWIVDITTQADRQERGGMFADLYEASELKAANDAELDGLLKQNSSLSPARLKELSVTRATVTPFWWALWIMFKFRTLRNYKDGAFLGPRIGDKLIFSLLIFSLYFGVGNDLYADNIINIAAVLFMWSTLPAFGAAAYVPSIVLERPLFTRERNDGLYRVITYLVSKMLEELMLAFVASLVFSCIVFYGVKLQGEWVLFWLVYLVTLSCGILLAYTVAACAPNMDVANAALPAYVVTLLFFSGFLIRSTSMPRYWFWYQYINFIRYAWHAQMSNQFVDNPEVLLNGKPVLEFYDVTDTKWANLGFESTFFIGFFFFAWLALSFCKHSKR